MATSTRKTPATKSSTKAAPAAKRTTKTAKADTPATGRHTLGSFDAAAVDTHKCAGACGQRLPVKKFPTVTGTTRRVSECRSCRDARTKAAKGTDA